MIILKHKWNTQKVHKLIDYLYTAKSKYDPMTHYMKNEMNSEMLYYLLQNPSLFANQYFYQQFIEMYFPKFAKEHPTYTGMLIQMAMMKDYQQRLQRRHQRMYEINYQKLIDYTNKQIRQDKRIKHDLQLNVEVDKLVKNTTRELTEHNERTLEGIIKGLAKQIEKDGLIDVPDIKKNKKLQEKLKKYQKQMERENKRLEKNWQNRVLWQKARLLDDKYKPTFKVWDQHPNPKTRHTQTDGQKVKLEEKFIVINDKTGDLDYVDYPGDWTCSPSNSANCLCTLSFTNDPHGYKPHEMLDKEKQKQSKDIHQSINFKKLQKEYIENLNKSNQKSQQELKEKYIEENGTLPSYLEDDSEYMFKEHNGKIYLIHIFGDKQDLILDRNTGLSKNNLYNRISKFYNATLENYKRQKTVKPDLFKSLEFYSGPGFKQFNEWKRYGIKSFIKQGLNIEEINGMITEFKIHERNLKRLGVEIEEDLILYRGQVNRYHSLKEGTVSNWDSFTSTSLGLGPAYGYSQGNYIYEIHIPKGKKVIPILQQGQNTKEIEILLPLGVQFIVKETRIEEGITIISVDVL